MKYPVVVLAFAAALLVFAGPPVMAGSTANHTVTVTVSDITELAIAGGNMTLTINSATAGSNPDDATDNTTCDLSYTASATADRDQDQTSLRSHTP